MSRLLRVYEDKPQGFCLPTLEQLMRDWNGGSYLVMKTTPIVPIGRLLMDIGLKYNSSRVLKCIATWGAGITEPGDPYLISLPDIYSNVSVCLLVQNRQPQ